ncbi:metallophosphoesterase family protein [Mucilaginibacter pocheonensis]|uniref:Calcineurin-like phosphoesterase family protein n=1 Tax=Mucilaginibacter pocheonensis TaxID=398050 RepID=A0ABU1TDP3_9SPHI|nr:metallophosphoesterase [Mucilaginibacter pocheonensis]MDR6943510.1 calcineurin-like phosphoesterase family protein [Mucilaginibacter pocheonensis]
MTTADPLQTKPVFKLDQPDDSYKFQPLPSPAGEYPYHLSADKILPHISDQKIIFHVLGDTGSVRHPENIGVIASAMARQYDTADVNERPQFLYHLGDIVYNYGEAEYYDEQFFTPYKNYPGPIFAIAGNHDSDINTANPVPYKSLDAFAKVFCDTISRPVSLGGGAGKTSMVQPNIYWTLKTPLVNIIGLHSNVPKFGVITAEQREWFAEELKANNRERPEKALFVCLHHAPYSSDINHGSSRPMIELLEDVFEETGIKPDLVMSGHVHNYQRFNKIYNDSKALTYIVAGAGGFDELHAVAQPDDKRFTSYDHLFDNIRLVKYCDSKHGFLKMAIEKAAEGLTITGEYYTVAGEQTEPDNQATLADRFTLQIPEK